SGTSTPSLDRSSSAPPPARSRACGPPTPASSSSVRRTASAGSAPRRGGGRQRLAPGPWLVPASLRFPLRLRNHQLLGRDWLVSNHARPSGPAGSRVGVGVLTSSD